MTKKKKSPVETLIADAGEQLLELPLDQIVPSGDNARADFGDLEGLAASIKETGGLVQPIVVSPNGGGLYHLVSGHRRLKAAELAGLATLTARVRDYGDDVHVARAVENVQRKDLNPGEEARQFQVMRDAGMSQREIAKRVGYTQPHVSKRLSLLDLPAEALAELDLPDSSFTVDMALRLLELAKINKRSAGAVFRKVKAEGSWHNLWWHTKRKIEELEANAERARIVKEFEERQLTVIDLPKVNPWRVADELPGGAVPIEGTGAIDIDADAHESEPCHAVAVLAPTTGGRDRGHVRVCTDLKRHGKVAKVSEREAAQRDAERKAEEVRRDELLAASRARQQVVNRLIETTTSSSPVKDALIDALSIALDLALEAVHGGLRDVLERLGLPAEDTYRGDVHRAALRAHAAQSPGHLLAVLYAVHCEEHETDLGRYHTDVGRHRDYLEWLQGHGHQLTDVERRELEQSAAAAAEREAVGA